MRPLCHFILIDHACDLTMLMVLVLIFIAVVFGAYLPHLGGGGGGTFSLLVACSMVCGGGDGARVGGMTYPRWYGVATLARYDDIGIVDIVYTWPTELNDMIIDRYMYGPPPAPALTQPLWVWRLHFPPTGRACTEASWRPVMYQFKLYIGTWIPWIYADEIIVHDIDRYMCTHLPAPPPGQSLESVEAPFPPPRKGWRQSWPIDMQPCIGSI